tara:strand:+ start:68 stop:343 length:276 start_codon:yes stop_codon:yes gene_type:complete
MIKDFTKRESSVTIRTMLKTTLIIIEIILGLLLIGSILLHSPKAEGLGAIGGQARTFSNTNKDMERGLTQFTTVVAVLFMAIATILGLLLT